jgi:uncharacterized RDD family membrane protein YckC
MRRGELCGQRLLFGRAFGPLRDRHAGLSTCDSGLLLWNFCYRQGKTGQSIGKSVLKFKVISEKTWQPIGFWLSFLRQIAHYVDQFICYIGYLFPLWDDKRQTLADKIMSTVCVPLDTPEPPPRAYGQPY